MNSSPRYFVRVGAEVRGPYDVAQLRQLAEVDVITPANEVASTREGPWQPAGALAQQAEIFPPRTEHAFRPTDFSVINDAATPPLDFRDIIAQAQVAGPVLRPSHPPDLAAHLAKKAAAEPNEVEAMVRAVQAREAQFAPPPPPPPKRPMKRKLLLVLVVGALGNLGVIAVPTLYRAWDDRMSMLIITGWFVVLNGGLVSLYVALPDDV